MKKIYKDILERVIWTAAQAFLATFVVTDLSSLKVAAVAAIAAALSVVKGLAATKVGDPESASFFNLK